MTGLHGRRGDERSPGDAETLEVGSWRGEEVGLSASDYRRDLTASASAWPTVAAILEHSSLLVTIRLYLHLHDSAAQVAVEVLAICRGGRGWRPFVCCQDFYNLLYRDIEKRLRVLARRRATASTRRTIMSATHSATSPVRRALPDRIRR